MHILMKRSGKFEFLDENYKFHSFTDYNDIPDDFIIKEVVCFLPEIPPPPHTVQQHHEIHLWDVEFKRLIESIYGKRD